MKYNVYTVGSQWDADWLRTEYKLVNRAYKADIIVFPGGSDINPSIYNEPVGKRTHFYQDIDKRQMEYAIDETYKEKLKIGLCRGAQLLCAISGGKLVQDFIGHGGQHYVLTEDNQLIYVNSLHHQMMFPFNLSKEDYSLIGRAVGDDRRSIGSNFLNGLNDDIGMPNDEIGYIEPEIAYFNKTRSLCFQFHPEMMSWDRNTRTLHYCNDLVDKYFTEK